ncbi:MAG: chaperone, ATP12 [Acetobacteraceae bacterium]|nr:chaperone, ATP12 [Acetobacteraceae bacterium]
MKRFWDTASAVPGPNGYAILLDGKPMHVPGGRQLLVHGAALALAIAAEWQAAGGAKGGEMTMEDVPLTRLAGTAQERITPDPAPVAEALAKFAENDLLCYRADHPLPLVVRQAREWQPWLDWLERAHGARLRPTEGITHIDQDPEALRAVRQALEAQPPEVLAALGIAIPALGSAALGLALAEGALDAQRAHQLASLDELFQVEQWGDDEWASRRRSQVAEDVAVAARFMELARAP